MDSQKVLVERIVMETPDVVLADIVRDYFAKGSVTNVFGKYIAGLREIDTPSVATRHGVSPKFYHGYRRGLMSACADVVCVSKRGKELAVPLISRAKPPFQGGWFVQGGAIFNYRLIPQFALWKMLSEAGAIACDMDTFLKVNYPAGFWWNGMATILPLPLGVYRTAAEDNLPGEACDTLNIAYLALLSEGFPFGHDSDHTALRWVTLPELEVNPNLCGHWYPHHLATRALQIVAAAKE